MGYLSLSSENLGGLIWGMKKSVGSLWELVMRVGACSSFNYEFFFFMYEYNPFYILYHHHQHIE